MFRAATLKRVERASQLTITDLAGQQQDDRLPALAAIGFGRGQQV
jgi:hypothetical protein